jgi:hypothetical protein
MQTDGQIGKGRMFDKNKSQYIDTLFNEDLPKFTVEAWVRANALPVTDKGPNGPFMRQRNFQMVWDHTDSKFDGGISFRSGGNWDGVDFLNVVAGEWMHLAATYDGAVLRSYVNGVQKASKNMGPPEAEASTAKIGRHAFDTALDNHFDGLIDEVRVSNVARDVQWIAAQHRSMKQDVNAKFVLFGPAQPGTYSLP